MTSIPTSAGPSSVSMVALSMRYRSDGRSSRPRLFLTWEMTHDPSSASQLSPDVFDKAAEDAGLAGLTPHELRHTAASLAVSAGANVKAVQRMLGHASAAMTLDVYSGLFDDDLDSVAARLDQECHPIATHESRAEVIELPIRC
jgi:integrase